jgi:hypothetical protein
MAVVRGIASLTSHKEFREIVFEHRCRESQTNGTARSIGHQQTMIQGRLK